MIIFSNINANIDYMEISIFQKQSDNVISTIDYHRRLDYNKYSGEASRQYSANKQFR